MQGNPWLPIAALMPTIGAAFAYVLGRRRSRYALVCMAVTSAAAFALLSVLFVQAIQGQPSAFTWEHAFVMGISFATDGFRAAYAWIAALMWGVTSVFSFAYFKEKQSVPRYAFFTLLTLSAVIGVFLSDQLLTTILFFEVLGLASYPWVAHDETPGAMRAAQSYLWIAIIGGLCLMLGVLLLPKDVLTARYSAEAAADVSAANLILPAALMLVGFGAKAGAFPLHVWLPKAHPAAPAPASALLSGMLLKTGVFGIMLLSVKFLRHIAAWHTLIFWIGVATMTGGAVLALLSVEMKRILACSSMSQIGFILLGLGLYGLLGEHGGVAAQGVIGHMVNHSLFKLILFLCAGVVAMRTHALRLNDIRGFGRGKPLLHFIFLSAMLGIVGVPLWSGFVSKSLLHESLTTYIRLLPGDAWMFTAAEWLFILSGALTLAYMLKLYICIFWERGAAGKCMARAKYLTRSSAALLTLCSAAVWLIGMFPSVFVDGVGRLGAEFMRAESETFACFTTENLLGAAKTLGIGLLVYGLVVRGLLSRRTAEGRDYADRKPAWIDLEDRVYRPLLKALTGLATACSWAVSSLPDTAVAGGRKALLHVRAWRVPMPGSNRLTVALGGLLNAVVAILNKTVRRHRPLAIDFTCALAAGNEELSHSMRRIKRSMSYSLLLFCLGLFGLLLYLMLW